MPEDKQSTAALDKAAAEAVEGQVSESETQTETPPEVVDETTNELEQELPQDHKERSDLGRKLSAYHRRVDGLESKIDRLLNAMESKPQREETPELDDNEPLTVAEYRRFMAQEEDRKNRTQKKYDDDYKNSVIQLGSDLTQDEWNAVIEEMNKMPLNSSGNPQLDAERNFYKAERIMLRKAAAKPAQKTSPLEKNKGGAPTGVATAQKSVVKDAVLPKLDSAAQSYLDMVAREDGEEKAQKLHKSLA